MVLRVADGAARLLHAQGGGSENESPVHQYWKDHYCRLYAGQGYRVTWEAPRGRGRTDVLAERASESVAIEIETGKSDAVHNVRQDLLAGFGRVLVVATNEMAFRQIERQLAKAGLVLPGRVALVLRDDPGQSVGSA